MIVFFSLSYKQSPFWCFGVSVMNMICICTLDNKTCIFLCRLLFEIWFGIQQNKQKKAKRKGNLARKRICSLHLQLLLLCSVLARDTVVSFLLCIVMTLIVCTGTCATACVQLAFCMLKCTIVNKVSSVCSLQSFVDSPIIILT